MLGRVGEMFVIIVAADPGRAGGLYPVTGVGQGQNQPVGVRAVVEVDFHDRLLEAEPASRLVYLCVDPFSVRVVIIQCFLHRL